MKRIICLAILAFICIPLLFSCNLNHPAVSDTEVSSEQGYIDGLRTRCSSLPTQQPESDSLRIPRPLVPDPGVTEFILPSGDSATAEELMEYMRRFPNLELMDTGSSVVSPKDYIEICKINPRTKVTSRVMFEDTLLDLCEDELDISGKIISDKELFEKLVSVIPDGKKLIMCDCGYSNTEMEQLRATYPEKDFVWRLYLGKWNLRTDDEAFGVEIYASDRYKKLTSEDIEVLKYCTNLYALDLGHQDITDISVIGGLTKLRILILVDNRISDIRPLSNLTNLQYLELFVNDIIDITPLAPCTELVDLNFGWNYVYDMTYLYRHSKLERIWLPDNRIDESRFDEIRSVFPNAKIVFEDKDSVSSGWRTHERYYKLLGIFRSRKYDFSFVK